MGLFADFQADAAAGKLPAYAFLEPSWSSTGNSEHPNYNVALGEQLLLDAYRAVPLDHTSILATIEHRWNLPALTRRDAAAPDVGGALSLTVPRTDDPLAGVQAPSPPPTTRALAEQPSHLQQLHDELLAQP
jgi:hypothetical protein